MSCALCERVEATKQGSYPFLVHEFKHSYLYLGEHQFYEGYCILVSKNHYREMTDMPESERNEFFQEMMTVHKLLDKTFSFKKMNMESLGNVVDHIHWHFFPRYADELYFKNPPFLQMDQFENAKIDSSRRSELIAKLKTSLTEM